MKKFLSGMLVGALLVSGAIGAATYTRGVEATFGVAVFANGKQIEADGVIIDSSTYLPVRAIATALGREVAWDPETVTVTLLASMGRIQDDVFTLGAGEYIGGEDIPAGKYDMIAKSGTGNFSFTKQGDKYAKVTMMFGANHDAFTPSYDNLRIDVGDVLEINHDVKVEFRKNP